MVQTRTIFATIEMACCRDGEEIYHPLPRRIIAPQTKDSFIGDPLSAWAARAEAALRAKYEAMAAEECAGMGTTPRLCLFRLTVDDVIETGKPTPPPAALEYLRTLESYIDEERDNISTSEDQISDILAIPSEERTDADRDRIRKLDSGIRKSNETIREYEYEIKQIKDMYEID